MLPQNSSPAASEALTPSDFRGGKTVADCLHNAIWHLQQAQKLNNKMQEPLVPGTDAWHRHEAIDDRLHDALSELGQ